MKICLVLLAVLYTFSKANGQEPKRYPVLPTFEFGANIANQQIRKDAQGVFEQMNGIRASVALEIPKTKRLTFLGSLSYVQSGSNNVLYTGASERLHYAELSIKAKEYLPIGRSDLFLSIGPYFSYGLQGKRTLANGLTDGKNLFKEENYNPIEWGLGGNIGLKFPWGSYLQAGLQTAFSNCYSSDQFQLAYFNYALMLTAGHSLNWRNFRPSGKRI